MTGFPHSTSYIELSQQALAANLAFIRSRLQADTQFYSVVKGNAYGHGIQEFVTMARACGVEHFATFSADEAWKVDQVDEGAIDIMIMGMLDDDQLAWAVDQGHAFFVFNQQRLEQAMHLARRMGKPARIHLELETGMNRTGLDPIDLGSAIRLINDQPSLVVLEGLCTHLAGAESIGNYVRIKKQHIQFRKQIKSVLSTSRIKPRTIHAACSAAMLRYPSTHWDLVRIGILQYGFFPSRETFIEYVTQSAEPAEDPLRRIISWKSRVMDVKSVPVGQFVGYGSSYLANANIRVAQIPVGYGHGYSRNLSNQGRVLIRGHRVNVVGMVNMNLIQVDVTEVPEVAVGDEVVLIGRQGEQEISVSSFSEFSDQINYELLTRLPPSIERRIIKD
ncbi:MAG: alanine racemase [Lewinellaceae bacterium]|nr:alanine racemase [Saprospiraceae bacterium]MCB9312212.1 alanine racemase [Lewinellaceae bacterium]HRW75621.1 alanine racemase [Saprospiraceae bacterium]